MPRRLIPFALRIWPTEIALLLAGGGWLARMITTDLFTVGASFAVMRQVPLLWWECLFGVALALLARGIGRQHAGTRGIALLAWAGVWMFIALLLHLGNPDAPGDSTYGALALAAGWAYLTRRWTDATG